MSEAQIPEQAPAAWVEELAELLRIPSVSADPARAEAVLEAGRWVADFITRIGGESELVEQHDGSLVLGEVPASSGTIDPPQVTLYGHYDVQPEVPLGQWESPPFEPEVRDGWIYARGATDNKGNLFCLLKGVESLAREGRLPVDVRILAEGQEEIGGQAIVRQLRGDERPLDAFVSFDSSRMKADQPMVYLGMRGLVYLRLAVETAAGEMHSGTYGGAAANALNALQQILTAVIPLPAELREGATPLSPEELRAVEQLDPERTMLTAVGAAAATPSSEQDFWPLTLAQPALDLHGIAGGSPQLQKSIVVPRAEATLSLRTAPGQDAERLAATLQQLLHAAAPAGAKLRCELIEATSGYLQDPDEPVVRLACEGLERATGRPALGLRAGGTIPILDLVARRGVPIVITGFGLPESNIHAANERFRLDLLTVGARAAAEILSGLGGLSASGEEER